LVLDWSQKAGKTNSEGAVMSSGGFSPEKTRPVLKIDKNPHHPHHFPSFISSTPIKQPAVFPDFLREQDTLD